MAASSILHAIMSCSAPTPADVVPTLAGHPRRWSSGVQVPHAFEHPGQAHPCVGGALDGHVELAPPRRFGSVDVPVDVDCGRRYSPEPQMAEGQRWVGGVQARDDLVLPPSRARSGGGERKGFAPSRSSRSKSSSEPRRRRPSTSRSPRKRRRCGLEGSASRRWSGISGWTTIRWKRRSAGFGRVEPSGGVCVGRGINRLLATCCA